MSFLKSTLITVMLGTSVTAFAAADNASMAAQPADSSQAAAASQAAPASQAAANYNQAQANGAQANGAQANAAQASSSAQNLKLGKITCKDFTALDETIKPKVVYWGIGHIKDKKVAVLNIEATDRVIPMVIEECTAHPEHSFLTTLKDKVRSVF